MAGPSARAPGRDGDYPLYLARVARQTRCSRRRPVKRSSLLTRGRRARLRLTGQGVGLFRRLAPGPVRPKDHGADQGLELFSVRYPVGTQEQAIASWLRAYRSGTGGSAANQRLIATWAKAMTASARCAGKRPALCPSRFAPRTPRPGPLASWPRAAEPRLTIEPADYRVLRALGKAVRAAKIGHLPDAAAAGLGPMWYVTATAVRLSPGRSSYKRDSLGQGR